MNYFIRGDAANAERIKAAFQKLGIDTLDFSFNSRHRFFFTIEGRISFFYTNSVLCDVIKSHQDYQELVLPPIIEPKSFYNQDLWQLVPKSHYDISNFHAGMPVLVRAANVCRWDYSVFSRITGNEDWPFAVCNGVSFTQCIPFEGNEHLLGTTDMPSEEFINW